MVLRSLLSLHFHRSHSGSCSRADPGSAGLGGAWDSAFPTSPQGMLTCQSPVHISFPLAGQQGLGDLLLLLKQWADLQRLIILHEEWFFSLRGWWTREDPRRLAGVGKGKPVRWRGSRQSACSFQAGHIPCSGWLPFFILTVSGNGAMGQDPWKGHSLKPVSLFLPPFVHLFVLQTLAELSRNKDTLVPNRCAPCLQAASSSVGTDVSH